MFPIEIIITKTGARLKVATPADLPSGVAFKVVSTTERPNRRDIRHRYADEEPLGGSKKEHRKEKEHNKERKRRNPNADNFVIEESVQVTRSGGLYVRYN